MFITWRTTTQLSSTGGKGRSLLTRFTFDCIFLVTSKTKIKKKLYNGLSKILTMFHVQ